MLILGRDGAHGELEPVPWQSLPGNIFHDGAISPTGVLVEVSPVVYFLDSAMVAIGELDAHILRQSRSVQISLSASSIVLQDPSRLKYYHTLLSWSLFWSLFVKMDTSFRERLNWLAPGSNKGRGLQSL